MLYDTLARPLGSLRVSVTDRCNLRCRYCMPEEHYTWLPRESILTFEETSLLVDIFTRLGVSRVRVTGGEPLLRHDLPRAIRMLRQIEAIDDLAMTTNAVLLGRYAAELKEAGLDRLTISLDTLEPDRFKAFAGRGRHEDVLEGIRAAHDVGFSGTKLNAVIIRGVNDDELVPLVEFGRERGIEVRFIEYMDVGGATNWSMDDVVPRDEMLEVLERAFGAIDPIDEGADTRVPADRFRLGDGTTVGIVASTTAPFCSDCDRSRITADGLWFTCLYAVDGIDLKEPLRGGVSDDELEAIIRGVWSERGDRGAEERLAEEERGPLYQVNGLRMDPHREMHTRGG
jgi:GTP 3',8-cyclase